MKKRKNQPLTPEYLDNAMEKQAAVILKAVDVKIEKSLAEQSKTILEAVKDGVEKTRENTNR
jgi:uncharacterized protein YllA (UPF0747 family)